MAAGAGVAALGEARHVALKLCRQLVCKGGLRGSCRDLLWSWMALGRGCGAARLPPVMLSPPLCRVGGCKAVQVTPHRTALQPGIGCHRGSSLQKCGTVRDHGFDRGIQGKAFSMVSAETQKHGMHDPPTRPGRTNMLQQHTGEEHKRTEKTQAKQQRLSMV